jgi:hypothetical protein
MRRWLWNTEHEAEPERPLSPFLEIRPRFSVRVEMEFEFHLQIVTVASGLFVAPSLWKPKQS